MAEREGRRARVLDVAGASESDKIAQIQAAAQQYLGRQFDDVGARQWAAFPQGIDAAIDAIRNSPEAQTYAARASQPAASVPVNEDQWFIDNPFPDGGTKEQQDAWRAEAAKHGQFASGGGSGTPYTGPMGGFDNARLAGGANDSTATNAKYYFANTVQKGGWDPYRVHMDRSYAEKLLAELNKNPYGWKYSLTAGNDFLNDQDNDGAYMGGRPVGGWSANAEDASNAANWQFQWLPADAGRPGGPAGSGGTGSGSLAGLNGYGGGGYNTNPTSFTGGMGGGGSFNTTPTSMPFGADGNNPTYWQNVGQNFGSLLEPWNQKFEFPAPPSIAPFVAGTIGTPATTTTTTATSDQGLIPNAQWTGARVATNHLDEASGLGTPFDASGQYVYDQTVNAMRPKTGTSKVWDAAANGWKPATTTAAGTQNANAPDWSTDPGYQFRMQEGLKALERAASARGTLLTGGTLKGLNDYAQNAASAEYGNIYGRKFGEWQTDYNKQLGEYTQKYNKALGEYQQAYNVFQNNQGNMYNRLAGLAGLGQSSTNQLASTGLGYSGLYSNTLQNNANTLASIYGNAANAGAAGIVGSANAWNAGMGNMFNNLTQTGYNLALLNGYGQPGFNFSTPR